ncbi:MAG: DUF1549 and DUF1553 domain-containing protein [Opitutaceae bacterium]|nr:DUF1549 and DUF1553 domain-containing protein [Opitutaceae bacterium]
MKTPRPPALLFSGLALVALAAAGLAAEARPPVRASTHWAFQPLTRPAAPAAKNTGWARNDLDRFILAAQEARGLTPNPEASRAVLIRRLAYGLTGLPPTPEEVAAFVNDRAPAAYERLVDRLLASAHYGEQWGRHWLDVARYADSNGYRYDDDQPEAYHYRDFVIRALNTDLPYDQFVRWQLAGNELAPANIDAQAATGFCAIGPKERDEGPPDVRKQIRYDELDDIVATTSSALLGLTLGCARCHDHKTEPISTREYYQLVRVFNAGERTVIDGARPLTPEQETMQREWFAEKQAIEDEAVAWFERHGAVIGPILAVKKAKLDADLAHVRKVFFQQNPAATEADLAREISNLNKNPIAQKYFLYDVQAKFAGNRRDVERLSDPRRNFNPLVVREVRAALSAEAVASYQKVVRRSTDLERRGFTRQDKTLVYADVAATPAATTILKRGSVTLPGEPVALGFIDVLTAQGYTPDTGQPAIAAPGSTTTYQRAALARWITDPESGAGGLLARVMVNRVWQQHFGAGLVRTPSDFGTTGDTPALPQLLDWLARDFIASGWSLKSLHRRMLLSAAYRQDTTFDATRAALDPENRTWWRRSPVRLSSENLRDAMLAVSGQLNPQRFGVSVVLPVPPEAIITLTGAPYPADIKDDAWIRRRSVYAYTKRTVPVPLLQLFDGTDASASCGQRLNTTVPTQALLMMNNDAVLARSADLADRILREAPGGLDAQLTRAFALALGRAPTSDEHARLARFHQDQLALRRGDTRRTLSDLCQVVFNLSEFIYVN